MPINFKCLIRGDLFLRSKETAVIPEFNPDLLFELEEHFNTAPPIRVNLNNPHLSKKTIFYYFSGTSRCFAGNFVLFQKDTPPLPLCFTTSRQPKKQDSGSFIIRAVTAGLV